MLLHCLKGKRENVAIDKELFFLSTQSRKHRRGHYTRRIIKFAGKRPLPPPSKYKTDDQTKILSSPTTLFINKIYSHRFPLSLFPSIYTYTQRHSAYRVDLAKKLISPEAEFRQRRRCEKQTKKYTEKEKLVVDDAVFFDFFSARKKKSK